MHGISNPMKKVILSLMLVAFAVAVQAGDGQCPKAGQGQCPKAGSCGGKAKKDTVASPKAGEQAKR